MCNIKTVLDVEKESPFFVLLISLGDYSCSLKELKNKTKQQKKKK